MNINDKDISFKKITNDSIIEGKKQLKHLFSSSLLVDHTYIYKTIKCEIFYKNKSTGLFWELPSLIDGEPIDFLNRGMDINVIKDAIVNLLKKGVTTK